MYKNRNTGTGNGMRGTRRMGGMLYSGECRQIFRDIPSNIPGIVVISGECPQIFGKMQPTIPANVVKHSGEIFLATLFRVGFFIGSLSSGS